MNNEQLLHAYLNGTATQKQVRQLEADPEFVAYIKIAKTAKDFDTPSFNKKAVREAIRQETTPLSKVKSLRPWKTFLRIAAVLCLLLGGYFYVNSTGTSVETSIAEKQHITLPDGSQVALNAESSVKYNENSWNKIRQLSLRGEAYFKVTKGQRFSVKTPTGTVRVLGTQFNIFARDGRLNVFCYEGLVSVAFSDTIIKLPKGHGLQLRHGKLVAKTHNNTTAPAWIANESRFKNVTLGTVLKELQRQYPVNVKAPEQILSKRFSVSFPHDNLDLALQLICAPLNLSYAKKDDQITLHAAQKN